MSKKIVTVCHCLRLIPVDSIFRFIRTGSRVSMVAFKNQLGGLAEVPGSVSMQTDVSDTGVSRVIEFEITDVTPKIAETLSLLSNMRLVATYVDESGNERVCGSPDYPLALDYYDTGGTFRITLRGISTEPDGFLK